MSKLWKVLVVLALGFRVDMPNPKLPEDEWGLEFNGPGVAILLYGILATVALIKVLNHLPGVFALRRPLGAVRSGYEYLWGPAIFAVLCGFAYTGVIEGRGDPEFRLWTAIYGAAIESTQPLVALVVFALLMWSLKLRATMVEANRCLEQAPPHTA